MKIQRHIFLNIIAATAAIMFFSCRNDLRDIQSLTNVSDMPVIQVHNAEIINSDSGYIKMILKAPLLNRFEQKEEPYLEFPEGVEIKFYSHDFIVTSALTANYSKFDEKKKIWESKGNVVAVNSKNEKLETEYLIWDQNLKQIHTDHFVKMSYADGVIYGDGLRANEDMTRWTVLNPRGIISIDE